MASGLGSKEGRGNDDFGSRHINDTWVSDVRADIGYRVLVVCWMWERKNYITNNEREPIFSFRGWRISNLLEMLRRQ